jgi:hypothetical protein
VWEGADVDKLPYAGTNVGYLSREVMNNKVTRSILRHFDERKDEIDIWKSGADDSICTTFSLFRLQRAKGVHLCF